jgi:hypothetical protein
MLTQLPTVKSRLGLLDADTQYDVLLTNAIKAISARFDKETNRTLARTVDATFEFPAQDTELIPPCYPIEAATKFELKTDESSGWLEQTNVKYLLRQSCVISLSSALYPASPGSVLCLLSSVLCRVTYTGGYVLPGTTPGAGQTPLPGDLEQAAVEQTAFWFQNRDRLGIRTNWPSGATYQQIVVLDLLPSVQAVLSRHARLTL